MRESLEILNIKEDANSYFLLFLSHESRDRNIKYLVQLQMHVLCYLVTIKHLHEKSILETLNT